jgi:hypothetical protein
LQLTLWDKITLWFIRNGWEILAQLSTRNLILS